MSFSNPHIARNVCGNCILRFAVKVKFADLMLQFTDYNHFILILAKNFSICNVCDENLILHKHFKVYGIAAAIHTC